MQDTRLITKITIPNYIREIEASKSQRKKYYEWNGTTIKSGSKKLLQKFINPISKDDIIRNKGNVTAVHLRDDYHIVGFKGDKLYSTIDSITGKEISLGNIFTEKQLLKTTKYILCEQYEDGMHTYSMQYKKVIANDTQAGKPKRVIINGQQIYNGGMSPFLKGKMFDELTYSYFKVFDAIPFNKLMWLRGRINESYPIRVTMEVQDTVKNLYDNSKDDIGKRWDVGNRTDPYMKTFLDFLSNGYTDEDGNVLLKPIIEDDDRLHVSSGNNSFFTPIFNSNQRKIIVHIEQDIRPVWDKVKEIQELQQKNKTSK